MLPRKNIIFDFDGTIADSLNLALKIYNHIAPEYNLKLISQKDKELLRSKKPQESLKEYGVSTFKLPLLVMRMRKELNNHIAEVTPIDDISESLYKIKKLNFTLGILTSNSRESVNKFLENNNLREIFNFIHSAKHFFGKDTAIQRLLAKNNISKENVVYVGDETRDIEAAKKIKIPIVSVSWGFNSRNALAALQPNQIADEPKELPACLQKIFNENV